MKEFYSKPYVEIETFKTEDVITTSGGGPIELPDIEL